LKARAVDAVAFARQQGWADEVALAVVVSGFVSGQGLLGPEWLLGTLPAAPLRAAAQSALSR
jgi:hypothetical protein